MARYADAIAWVVANDCTEFLEDSSAGLSVAASLVADLFGKSDAQVRADLQKELKRLHKELESEQAQPLARGSWLENYR